LLVCKRAFDPSRKALELNTETRVDAFEN